MSVEIREVKALGIITMHGDWDGKENGRVSGYLSFNLKQQEAGGGIGVSQKQQQRGFMPVLGDRGGCTAKSLPCTTSYCLLSADHPSLSYLEKPMRTRLPGRWVTSHCIPPLW